MDIKDHIESIAALAKGARNQPSRKQVSPADTSGDSVPGFDDSAHNDDADDAEDEQSPVEKRIEVEILKASDEEQTVTGLVLQPEVVDAHGDIMSADVIKQAAYGFLQSFNRTTKLGVQHSTFPKGKLALVESYLAPNGIVLGVKTIRQGSWIMTVKVLDSDLWKKVKDGKISGFSIGGKAKVVPFEE